VFRGLLDYFPRACIAVAEVSAAGAEKYAWKGWEGVDDGYNRYSDAGARHIVKKAIEGPWDSEMAERGKRILHDAQVAWNALAALELYLRAREPKPNVAKGPVPTGKSDVYGGYMEAREEFINALQKGDYPVAKL
jgi:hypothetical protein